jgi:DNA-binding LytR/AlgR family response regulator
MYCRIHRSGIINLAFLKELVREGDRKYVAVLGDDLETRVPVSRERIGELKSRLGLEV